jgi:hypothetical protein
MIYILSYQSIFPHRGIYIFAQARNLINNINTLYSVFRERGFVMTANKRTKSSKSNPLPTTKTKRGKPFGAKNKRHVKDLIPQTTELINDLEVIPGLKPVTIEDDKEICTLDKKLTDNELKFVELYLVGGINIDKAMIATGYGGYTSNSRTRIAKKILVKYECSVGDHRKIMRALGWGEVQVIQSLIEAATGFNSETVKLNARIALAKCIGIQRDVLEQAEGIQIVINQGGLPACEDQPVAFTLESPKAPPPSSGALQITK